jgi:hypothetical protein
VKRAAREPSGAIVAPKGAMNDLLLVVLLLSGWVALQRWILPRLGVPT